MPLRITTKNPAKTAEPNIKSTRPNGPGLLMQTNTKHEQTFHATMESGQLFVRTSPHNTEPVSHPWTKGHGSRGKLLTMI
jgi:hypothetical protein